MAGQLERQVTNTFDSHKYKTVMLIEIARDLALKPTESLNPLLGSVGGYGTISIAGVLEDAGQVLEDSLNQRKHSSLSFPLLHLDFIFFFISLYISLSSLDKRSKKPPLPNSTYPSFELSGLTAQDSCSGEPVLTPRSTIN